MDQPMTPIHEAIINDFFASFWIKNALLSALRRDPVDALNDAKTLSQSTAREP